MSFPGLFSQKKSKLQKIQSEYKPVGLSLKKEIFRSLQYFCTHCGWNTYDPKTMDYMIGKYQEHIHHTDGAGIIRCSYCNNPVVQLR